jgi:hypothetical protein
LLVQRRKGQEIRYDEQPCTIQHNTRRVEWRKPAVKPQHPIVWVCVHAELPDVRDVCSEALLQELQADQLHKRVSVLRRDTIVQETVERDSAVQRSERGIGGIGIYLWREPDGKLEVPARGL